MILEFLNLFIILGIIVGIVFFVKKYLTKKNYGPMKNSEYINILDEGITLSLGQKLSIIKVGEELFLMTYGQNGVSFQKINEDILRKEKEWEAKFQGENHQDSFKKLGEMLKNDK